MAVLRVLVRAVDRLLRRIVYGLSLLGDAHLHAELERARACRRPTDPPPVPWPLRPPVTLAPPGPDHPERLLPDVPLSEQERRLTRELAHLRRLLPGTDG